MLSTTIEWLYSSPSGEIFTGTGGISGAVGLFERTIDQRILIIENLSIKK